MRASSAGWMNLSMNALGSRVSAGWTTPILLHSMTSWVSSAGPARVSFTRAASKHYLPERTAEDFSHDLLGVKMRLGDVPGRPAVPPVVGVHRFKRIGRFLKRGEPKHAFAIGE